MILILFLELHFNRFSSGVIAGSAGKIPLSWLSNDCAILICSHNSARISAGLRAVVVVVVVGGVVVVAVVVVVVILGVVVVVVVVGGESAAQAGFLTTGV